MKLSPFSRVSSSLFFVFALSFGAPAAWAQSGNASTHSLLQRIDDQDRRIQELEQEVARLRSQIGLQSPPPPKPAPSPPAAPPSRSPDATASTTPSKPPSGARKAYTIEQGDTLSRIARAQDVSVADLVRFNNLSSPNDINMGDRLWIPVPGATAPPAQQATAAAPPAPTPPQVPERPRQTITYTVRPGDTLSSIARAQSATVDSIIRENGIGNPNSLSVGQQIRIPGGTPQATQSGTSASATTGTRSGGSSDFPSGFAYYTVIPGDNLFSIARIFGTTQAELERLNGFAKGSTIRPNQQIVVPMQNYSGPYRTS